MSGPKLTPEVAHAFEKYKNRRKQRQKKNDESTGSSSTPSSNNGDGGNGGELKNIKLTVSYRNVQETLKRRFSGNDCVSAVAEAIADQITGSADSVSRYHYYGKKVGMNLIFGKTPQTMDVRLSSIKNIRGDEQWNQHVHVSFRVIGGADDPNNDKKNDEDRERMADFENEERITPTLEPDCIFGWDDRTTLRVKMPCGHVFDPQTLFQLTKMYVNNLSKSKIYCPVEKCQQVWDFDIVAAAADLDDDEKEKFFGILSKRALLHSGNYKECQNCQRLVEKPDDIKMIRVRCAFKSCQSRQDFCWCCGGEWVGGGFTVCGNKDCSTEQINDLLQTCDIVKPDYLGGEIECPAFRVCPRCLTLVQWEEKCKHIKCWGCNKEFCYVCCGLKSEDNKWPCGAYNHKCPVHKRQSLK